MYLRTGAVPPRNPMLPANMAPTNPTVEPTWMERGTLCTDACIGLRLLDCKGGRHTVLLFAAVGAPRRAFALVVDLEHREVRHEPLRRRAVSGGSAKPAEKCPKPRRWWGAETPISR